MRDMPINDETRDRAVRWVLWTSLGIAVVPMVVALALVQPTLARLSHSDAAGHLEDELTLTQSSDSLGSILSRSASGFVRAVKSTLIPEVKVAVPELRPLGEEHAARFASGLGEEALGCVSADVTVCGYPAIERLRASAGAPLQAAPTSEPRRQTISLGLGLLSGPPSEAPLDIAWRAQERGVYVADLGGTFLTVSGAVNDYSSLRPISEVGVGGYLAGAPELHYGGLSGGVARTFDHGGWRVRPELDVAASYLDLDKVWLDVGEAGLFLPETEEDWIFSARPSLAFEGEIEAAPGFKLAPSLRAGATWLSQTEYSEAAMMLDAPAMVAGVNASLPVEELFADFEAGLGLAASENLQLQVSYGRMIGEAFEAQTGRVELNMQF